jgi:hypothetical protein
MTLGQWHAGPPYVSDLNTPDVTSPNHITILIASAFWILKVVPEAQNIATVREPRMGGSYQYIVKETDQDA